VLNDLDKKKWFFEFSADSIKIIDSIKKSIWIKEGKINFKKSNTKLDTCKIYCLETFYNQKKTDIYIKNCKKNVLVYNIIDNADK
jgi:predicted RNA-binding protein with PUA domain